MIHLNWANEEKTVLYWQFDGFWTFEDYIPVYEEALRELNSVNHPVTAIVDMRHSQTDESILRIAQYSYERSSVNLAQTYIVGSKETWGSLYVMLKWVIGIIPTPIHVVPSVEAAYRALNDQNVIPEVALSDAS